MDTLNNLNNLNVPAQYDNRISDKDKIFCETHYKAYKTAKKDLQELEAVLENIKGRQSNILKNIDDHSCPLDIYININNLTDKSIQNKIERIHFEYIGQIVKHFNHNYHISIDLNKIYNEILPNKPERFYFKANGEEFKKYYQEIYLLNIDYKDILKQIFEQLNGRTFQERAIDEIKEKCKKASIDYYGNPIYELKNDTIAFNHYVCFHRKHINLDIWTISESFKEILLALALFETGMIGKYPPCINSILKCSEINNSNIPLDCDKVKQMKLYKNGRIDIKFTSKYYANRFIYEYFEA